MTNTPITANEPQKPTSPVVAPGQNQQQNQSDKQQNQQGENKPADKPGQQQQK